MRHLFYILFLLSGVFTYAQKATHYKELLSLVDEIKLTDSLYFKQYPETFIELDSNMIKAAFSPLYHLTDKKNGGKIFWSLAGKISTNCNFDLLLLIEKNQNKDTIFFNTLHLISMSKEGEYIASFGLIINRNTKLSSYNTSSALYKNLTIVQKTKITANERRFACTNEYRITEDGFFEHYIRTQPISSSSTLLSPTFSL